jgi:hypothetical protein
VVNPVFALKTKNFLLTPLESWGMNIFTTSDAVCNCALLIPQAQKQKLKENIEHVLIAGFDFVS